MVLVGEMGSSPEHVAKRDTPLTPVFVGCGDSDDYVDGDGVERTRSSVNDDISTVLIIREQIHDHDQVFFLSVLCGVEFFHFSNRLFLLLKLGSWCINWNRFPRLCSDFAP